MARKVWKKSKKLIFLCFRVLKMHIFARNLKPRENLMIWRWDLPQSTLADRMELKIPSFHRFKRCNFEELWRNLKILWFFSHFSLGTVEPDEKSTKWRRDPTKSTLADRMELIIPRSVLNVRAMMFWNCRSGHWYRNLRSALECCARARCFHLAKIGEKHSKMKRPWKSGPELHRLDRYFHRVR